ncbi:MAG: OsmC family protein [Pseudomonadota bacterium]
MSAERIKLAAEREIAELTRDPVLGQGRGRTTVRAPGGLTCEIEGDGRHMIADMPESCGGGGKGPDPGFLIRAALGSCLAIDCRTWAARFNVPIDDIEIEIESQLDARGMLGLSHDIPPGYQKVACAIKITSPASPDAVRRVVELAKAHNPRLYDMTHAIPVACDLTVVESSKETLS